MAEPISIQQLKNASLDVKSLEEVVNGDENVVVTTRLGETYPSVKGSIKELFENGGLPATPFATKALMTASALVDGKYAMVTDDTANNGLYVKTAGAWVKSAYDPVKQAVVYADKVSFEEANKVRKLIDNKPDSLPFEEVSAYLVSTNVAEQTGGYLSSDFVGALSVVIPVEPNTEYTVEKEASLYFDIVGFVNKPKAFDPPTQYIKSSSMPHVPHIGSNGKLVESYTFTTNTTTKYVVVYLKRQSSQITPYVQVKKGGVFDFMGDYLELSKDVIFGGKTLSDIPSTALGKNLFDGNYEKATLAGNTDSEAVSISGNETARLAIVPVKPSTTYTVSKTESNRFKVAVTQEYPSKVGLNAGRVLMGDDKRTDKLFTFTTLENENFALIFVALGGEAPVFMQVEEGTVKTQWMTYGKVLVDTPKHVNPDGSINYDPDNDNTDPVSSYLKYLDIGVGNAKYSVRGNPEVYTDSSMTTVATDDTDALQAAFDRGGVIHLNGNKVYKVTRPLDIDLVKVREINGNGATIISTHDGVTLRIVGEQTTTAATRYTTAMSMFSSNRHIKGVRLTSATGFTGQACTIEKTFKFEFDVEVYWMRKGIEYIGMNRNIRLRPKIYSILEDGLIFAPSLDLHQGQVYDMDISYCKRNIVFDDPGIYNLQFLGGNCECATTATATGTPSVPDQLIYINIVSGIIADVLFSDMTIEDHSTAGSLITIDGGANRQIRNMRFSDCFYGNALNNCFDIKNIHSLSITGKCTNISDYFMNITGQVSQLSVNVTTTSTAGLLKAIGNFPIKNSSFKFTSNAVNKNAVLLDCNIEQVNICDNQITSFTLTDFDNTKGHIDVVATGRSIKQLRINNNSISTPSAITDAVKVTGTTGRIRVQGNDATHGTFPTAVGNIVSSDNYTG